VLESVTPRGDTVLFRWEDGCEAEFAAAWLLDNAPAAHAGTQRLRTMRSLASQVRHVEHDGDAIRLYFADETIAWTAARLRVLAAPGPVAQPARWPKGDTAAARPPIGYDAYLAGDAVLRAALEEVAAFGIVRFADAGAALDEVERAVRRFGFVRETNYGRVFEVRVTADPVNLADTARALEPHTDNPYRDPVPTLQLLHCIRSAGEGGATYFLDGIALAEAFRVAYPRDFACLAAEPVPFVFENAAGDRYECRTPVIRCDASGMVRAIRLNHRALGSIDLPARRSADWYASYAAFARAANDPARHFIHAMAPGDMVLFDNERILHGRKAFASVSDRLLRGCYADRDGLLATLARLRKLIA
jgi:gamma-butyrobetaine dioxygenase